MLLNNYGSKKKKKKRLKDTETNGNDNTTYQKFGDAAKAVLRGEFIEL